MRWFTLSHMWTLQLPPGMLRSQNIIIHILNCFFFSCRFTANPHIELFCFFSYSFTANPHIELVFFPTGSQLIHILNCFCFFPKGSQLIHILNCFCFFPRTGSQLKKKVSLKVHKREKFFVSDFEFFTIYS
jgi:hypothetical protein